MRERLNDVAGSYRRVIRITVPEPCASYCRLPCVRACTCVCACTNNSLYHTLKINNTKVLSVPEPFDC